jgi:hypothetical protein
VLEVNARARRFHERAGGQTDGARRMHRFGEGEVETPIVRYRRRL